MKIKITAAMVIITVALGLLCVTSHMFADKITPEITVPANEIVYEEGADKSILLKGVTAVDDIDGDISNKVRIYDVAVMADGENALVTYAVYDDSYNLAKAYKVVTYIPTEIESQDETDEDADSEESENEDDNDEAKEESEKKDEKAEAKEESEKKDEKAEAKEESEKKDEEAEANEESEKEDEKAEVEEESEKEDDKAEAKEKSEKEDDKAEANEESEKKDEKEDVEESSKEEKAASDWPFDNMELGAGYEDPEMVIGEAPVIRLKTHYVTLMQHSTFNAVEYVDTIIDDKDSRNSLFYKIYMDGDLDTSKVGVYELTYYCLDSNGNESNKAKLLLRITELAK